MRAPLRSIAVTTLALAGTFSASACLSRPVSTIEPETKTSLVLSARQAGVDKIDLLFMIDNSASMADKQEILGEAVPDLITSLVRPSCLDDDEKPTGELADPNAESGKECKNGHPEFKPVTDLHIGIVSSSMGGMGGSGCADPSRPHERDGARLLRRAPDGGEVSALGPANYLAWFPDVAANRGKAGPEGTPAIGDLAQLTKLTVDLVRGVGDDGCGFEAQLESVYHFLSDPRPYSEVKVVDGKATLAGVDKTLLGQRAAFLRPDSLVAVVMLTDEDDSQVDPTSLGGLGYRWAHDVALASNVPRASVNGVSFAGTTSAKGTSVCAQDPSSEACKSCLDPSTKGDPACAENGGFFAGDQDYMNVRFHKMKARFGIDPQFPIARYVDGLTKTKVASNGRTCTNPLFAAALPPEKDDYTDAELCDLPVGKRRPEQVFFAVIGGVPQDLLHYDPASPGAPLTEAEWDGIVGKDETHYARDEGVDPRMIQSTKPRAGRPQPSITPGDNAEGTQLRDYDTKNVDLQYACTFPLKKERDCSTTTTCDCNGPFGLRPPLCGKTGKTQVSAKAYPTPRELRVVRSLGQQGIPSSLCPISLDPTTGDGKPNPLYGYRPAVGAVVERLKSQFSPECLPQKLDRDESGTVPCVVLHSLPVPGARCQDIPGLSPAEPEVAEAFLRGKRASGDRSYDGKTLCEATQLPTKAGESCVRSDTPGYCYVENTESAKPLRRCSQAVQFSRAGAPREGMTTDLACIQRNGNDANAGRK